MYEPWRPLLAALPPLRRQVRWQQPEAASARLRQRLQMLLRLGHLPLGATLTTYEAIIMAIAADPDAEVHLCHKHDAPSLALLSSITHQPWILVLDPQRAVIIAFPSANPATYLTAPDFTPLGTQRALATTP